MSTATPTLARDLRNRERRARRALTNAGFTLAKIDGKYDIVGLVETDLSITAVERFAVEVAPAYEN